MIYVTSHGSGVTIKRLAIRHKDPFVLRAKMSAGWLRAMRLMDNHVPFQKCVRPDWTDLLWCSTWPHFYYYCSSQELYVLSHSYSNENKASDRGGLWRQSVATKHGFFFRNVLLSNMFVLRSEVTGSSSAEPREASWTQLQIGRR